MNLRIRQAEHAMAGGRLEEAADLLREAEVRFSPGAQQLVGRLIDMLVERGRSHLAAGRLAPAQGDADRALALGGNLPAAAQLHSACANAIANTARHARRSAELLAAAQQQIHAGHLNLGEKWLAGLSVTESRARILFRDLDVKKVNLENALQSAEAALSREDLAAAVREVTLARQADANDTRVAAICFRATEKLKDQFSVAIQSGRLDLAHALASQLATLCGETSDVEQCRRTLGQCRAAWQHLQSGEPGLAAEILQRILIIFPSASWIDTALTHMKQADEAISALRGGPLALMPVHDTSPERSTGFQPAPRTAHPSAMFGGPNASPNNFRGMLPPKHQLKTGATEGSPSFPRRFMLRVDGVGSFCVFRSPVITIGPISSSHQPDLGLIAEPEIPLATIERRDDEYFIRGSAVAVNDRAGTGKLLADGDRIALSPRCRMSFNLPSAASTTAVLDLTGCRYPRADVRRVILLDRDIIFSSALASHVRLEGAEENVILHLRGDRLFCEAKQPVEVNGAAMDRMLGIPSEARVKVGNVSFAISEG